MLRVATHKEGRGARGEGRAFRSRNSHVQHGLAEIEPGHLRALSRQSQSDITCPAADIQSAVAGPYSRKFNQPPFPVTVQAEALQVVEQIIAAGDSSKKVLDFRRALLALLKKLVR